MIGASEGESGREREIERAKRIETEGEGADNLFTLHQQLSSSIETRPQAPLLYCNSDWRSFACARCAIVLAHALPGPHFEFSTSSFRYGASGSRKANTCPSLFDDLSRGPAWSLSRKSKPNRWPLRPYLMEPLAKVLLSESKTQI